MGSSDSARAKAKSYRRKIIAGKPLSFSGNEPIEERTIQAEWLAEAARKPAKIDVRRAVIRGELALQYVTFEEEVSLISCDIKERADFSYTIFKRNLLLTDTTFHQGATFESASMEYHAMLGGARFLAGEANFRDVHFHGIFSADNVHFSNGVKVNFNRARFDKTAFFRDTTFEGEANFIGVGIGSQANFTGARFNSKDKPASFSSAKIDGDALFNSSTFEGKADFSGAEFGSQANFTGARFNSKDKPASFNSARFHGGAYFNNSIFEGEANFASAEIRSQANFTGARFNSKDKPASFDEARIDGIAVFKRTSFAGKARFLEVHMGREASFQGAVFKQKVSFNRAKLDGSAFFRPEGDQGVSAAVFKGEADFRGMVIGSNAEFQEVVFEQGISFDYTEFRGIAIFHGAQFPDGSETSFRGTKFQGGAFFQKVEFRDAVNFRTAQFDGESRFNGARFSKEAKFNASRFTGLARFGRDPEERHLRGAVFNRVSFEHARFEHDARFDDVVFQGETSFRETSFMTVYFSPKGLAQGKKQFQGSVDLRGCVYERVEVDRKSLLEHLAPYDRQPYTQLEKVFRAIGQDGEADEVYLVRRRVEHRRLSNRRESFRWFGAWLYKWVANYGVRPYRLIVIPLILLVLGAIVFSRPLAVEMNADKQPAELVQSKAPTRNNTDASTQRRGEFTGWDALRLSIRLFLPVEVPLATRWKPSDKPFGPLRFSDYATLLTLAGWVLVPLGIAALTGLLRRVAP